MNYAGRVGDSRVAGDGAELRSKAILVTVLLWTFHYLLLSATWGFGDSFTVLRRVVWSLVGILICSAIYLVLERLQGRRFRDQVLATFAMAFPAAVLFTAINILIYGFDEGEDVWTIRTQMFTYWLWFFFAWSSVILALAYSLRVQEEQRARVAAQAMAHQAQLRALRYQLNPHFLFNTLNSIVALVSRAQTGPAGAMLENLSDFLRTSLALDPDDDISLEKEIELQKLYLEIELIRFPKRLTFNIDVPDDTRLAMVPSLILQPLVENAIKYGVARSSIPVHLDIVARKSGGRLLLSVENDVGNALPGEGGGTKVGLRNVEGRIRARFGDEGAFFAGVLPQGGFKVDLAVPLRFAKGAEG